MVAGKSLWHELAGCASVKVFLVSSGGRPGNSPDRLFGRQSLAPEEISKISH